MKNDVEGGGGGEPAPHHEANRVEHQIMSGVVVRSTDVIHLALSSNE